MVDRLRLRTDVKEGTRPVEADVELHKEVHLSQDDGDRVNLGPREGQPDRRKLLYLCCHKDDACLYRGQIARELHGRRLVFPFETQRTPRPCGRTFTAAPVSSNAKTEMLWAPSNVIGIIGAKLADPSAGSRTT